MRCFFTVCLLLIHLGTFAQSLLWTQKANPQHLAINGVAFRPDGLKVLSGTNCHPATIRMYDVSSSNLDWNYVVPSSYLCIMGVGISSNSKYIISIEEFGNLFVFDNTGTTPTLIDSISTGTAYAFSNEISPNDQQVAVGCSNGKLKIFSLIGGQLIHDISAHTNWVNTVSYGPQGDRIVTGGNDRLVKIWDSTGTLLHTCSGHNGVIKKVKVTPDNKYVLSASQDKTIKVWDVNTGSLIRTITGHTATVNGLDVSPDAKKVVSASQDASCKIWEISTGNLLGTFGVVDSVSIQAVAWSPLGDRIATGNVRSDLSIWDVSSSLSVVDRSNSFGNINLYPNPARGEISIELRKADEFELMNIYDMNARKIFASDRLKRLNITSLRTGVYIVELIAKNKSKAFLRLVKE